MDQHYHSVVKKTLHNAVKLLSSGWQPPYVQYLLHHMAMHQTTIIQA
jgi:hypothetical protein